MPASAADVGASAAVGAHVLARPAAPVPVAVADSLPRAKAQSWTCPHDLGDRGAAPVSSLAFLAVNVWVGPVGERCVQVWVGQNGISDPDTGAVMYTEVTSEGWTDAGGATVRGTGALRAVGESDGVLHLVNPRGDALGFDLRTRRFVGAEAARHSPGLTSSHAAHLDSAPTAAPSVSTPATPTSPASTSSGSPSPGAASPTPTSPSSTSPDSALPAASTLPSPVLPASDDGAVGPSLGATWSAFTARTCTDDPPAALPPGLGMLDRMVGLDRCHVVLGDGATLWGLAGGRWFSLGSTGMGDYGDLALLAADPQGLWLGGFVETDADDPGHRAVLYRYSAAGRRQVDLPATVESVDAMAVDGADLVAAVSLPTGEDAASARSALARITPTGHVEVGRSFAGAVASLALDGDTTLLQVYDGSKVGIEARTGVAVGRVRTGVHPGTGSGTGRATDRRVTPLAGGIDPGGVAAAGSRLVATGAVQKLGEPVAEALTVSTDAGAHWSRADLPDGWAGDVGVIGERFVALLSTSSRAPALYSSVDGVDWSVLPGAAPTGEDVLTAMTDQGVWVADTAGVSYVPVG